MAQSVLVSEVNLIGITMELLVICMEEKQILQLEVNERSVKAYCVLGTMPGTRHRREKRRVPERQEPLQRVASNSPGRTSQFVPELPRRHCLCMVVRGHRGRDP